MSTMFALALALVGCSKGKSDVQCHADEWCKSRGHCTANGGACIAAKDFDCFEAQVCTEQGKCTASNGECVPGGVAPPDSSFAKRQNAAAEAVAKAAADARIAQYKAWGRDQRVGSADASGWDQSKDLNVVDELVRAADSEEERAQIGMAFRTARARSVLKGAKDGMVVAPEVFKAAALLGNVSIRHLRSVEHTSIGEVRKDPAPHRGKLVEVQGSIVQIRREGAFFQGLLMGNGFKPIHFITPGSTDKLVEDSRASFVGLFAHQYAFANVAGGETQSIVLVGHFKGQGMD